MQLPVSKKNSGIGALVSFLCMRVLLVCVMMVAGEDCADTCAGKGFKGNSQVLSNAPFCAGSCTDPSCDFTLDPSGKAKNSLCIPNWVEGNTCWSGMKTCCCTPACGFPVCAESGACSTEDKGTGKVTYDSSSAYCTVTANTQSFQQDDTCVFNCAGSSGPSPSPQPQPSPSTPPHAPSPSAPHSPAPSTLPAPSPSSTTVCGAMGDFVTSLNEAVGDVCPGGAATCDADGPYGAKIAIDADFNVLGIDFGDFGLYMDVQPCRGEPTFVFGTVISGADSQLTSLTYGKTDQVPIPGLDVVVASLDLAVEIDGTLQSSSLKLGLGVDVAGMTTDVWLTGNGIDFSIANYKCPSCAYLLDDLVPTPQFLSSMSCTGVYAVIATTFVVFITLIVVACCACKKCCCFRPRKARNMKRPLLANNNDEVKLKPVV